MSIKVAWRSKAGLDRMERSMHDLGAERKFASAAARSLNKVGGKARTQVQRNLVKQTGLARSTIVRAVQQHGASPGRLAFELRSHGGDIALKYFSPKEFRAGVKAKPFGKSTLFPGTFLRAGWFPSRVETTRFGGHVMKRTGADKWPVESQDSGVIIPAEMVKGQSLAAWRLVVDRDLPARLMHDLSRAAGGAFS